MLVIRTSRLINSVFQIFFSVSFLRAFFSRLEKENSADNEARGGGVVLGLMFAGYVPLASQRPYPIKVYFLANYRSHLSHFLEHVIFAIPT